MSKNINYRISVKLNANATKVINKLFDYDELKKYQAPRLITYHHMRGQKLDQGTVTRLFYDYNGKKIYMDEYIIENNLPDGIIVLYTMGNTKNRLSYTFKAIDDKTTLWTNEVVFDFDESMVVDKLFYIKQTEADMKAFKDFIEHDKTS